jgi:hypothetical protein
LEWKENLCIMAMIPTPELSDLGEFGSGLLNVSFELLS